LDYGVTSAATARQAFTSRDQLGERFITRASQIASAFKSLPTFPAHGPGSHFHRGPFWSH